jgi:hypothetical protein
MGSPRGWTIRFQSLWKYGKMAMYEPQYDSTQHQIKEGKKNKRHRQAGHGCHGIAGVHNAFYDPGLPSDFRDYPSGFDGNQSQWSATHKTPKKSARFP